MELDFKDYLDRTSNYDKIAVRISTQGYYDVNAVEKNFYKVIDVLGDFDKNDWIASITIRLKNKVNGIPTDYPIARMVARSLKKKFSRKFKGRKGHLPSVFAIESNKGWFKEHIHCLIRFKNLQYYKNENEIETSLRTICNNMDEVNSSDPSAIDIRMFHYWEDHSKQLGNSIEYICKTSCNFKDHTYDPLLLRL